MEIYSHILEIYSHILPMIDMNANDMSSVYSTTRFVAAECRRLQPKPILTFDQPYGGWLS